MTAAYKDINSNIYATNYKWTTNELMSAQNSPVVRPYLECKIVDDSLVYNQSIITSVTTSGMHSGKVVQSPDGSLLAVGRMVNGG